jgi:IS30 family transposase
MGKPHIAHYSLLVVFSHYLEWEDEMSAETKAEKLAKIAEIDAKIARLRQTVERNEQRVRDSEEALAQYDAQTERDIKKAQELAIQRLHENTKKAQEGFENALRKPRWWPF